MCTKQPQPVDMPRIDVDMTTVPSYHTDCENRRIRDWFIASSVCLVVTLMQTLIECVRQCRNDWYIWFMWSILSLFASIVVSVLTSWPRDVFLNILVVSWPRQCVGRSRSRLELKIKRLGLRPQGLVYMRAICWCVVRSYWSSGWGSSVVWSPTHCTSTRVWGKWLHWLMTWSTSVCCWTCSHQRSLTLFLSSA